MPKGDTILAICCHSSVYTATIPISSLWASVSLITVNLKSLRKNGFRSPLQRVGDSWVHLALRLTGGVAACLAWGLGP